jgi:hypothetical protein
MYLARYFYYTIILCVVAGSSAIFSLVERLDKSRIQRFTSGYIFTFFIIFPFIVTIARFGYPGINKPRIELEKKFNTYTSTIIQSDITFVAGDYWRVWPAVFHANWKLHGMGDEREVFGISFRSLPTRNLGLSYAKEGTRMLHFKDDSEFEIQFDAYFQGKFSHTQAYVVDDSIVSSLSYISNNHRE